MESIPEHKILRFHPDTMQKIRKMYNFDGPGEMDNAITIIEEWLKKQHHLTKREYPRSYLERSIILQKGSLERTKAQINNICAMRTVLPEFFIEDEESFENVRDGVCYAGLLPSLTEDNYRVVNIMMLPNAITSQKLFEFYRNAIRTVEYLTAHDYCCGIILVLDYRKVNIMEYVAVVNITELYHMIKIMMVGYSLRIKGIHLLTSSKSIYTFYNMVKKMFSSKMANRMYIHPNVEELYEYVPRDILPQELGGFDTSIASLYEEWKLLMGCEKMIAYRKEMSEAKSTQTNTVKQTISYTDFGLSGSFRTLSVD